MQPCTCAMGCREVLPYPMLLHGNPVSEQIPELEDSLVRATLTAGALNFCAKSATVAWNFLISPKLGH